MVMLGRQVTQPRLAQCVLGLLSQHSHAGKRQDVVIEPGHLRLACLRVEL
jgi:hypothetical protein